MVREEEIQTVRAEAVYGIPLQVAYFPPTNTIPTAIPLSFPLRRCSGNYTLVKCKQEGCNTELPNDLVWCYFHKPNTINIY
jgi:hypothetical protein